MSVRAMTLVWEASKHKGSDLLVFLAIADHVGDENGLAWPSIKHLADKSRMSHRNTQRCVQALLASGELMLVRQGDGRKSSVYRLNSAQLNEGRQVVSGDMGDTAGMVAVTPESSVNHQIKSTPTPSFFTDAAKEKLGGIFGRRKTTVWKKDELVELESVLPLDDQELSMVEAYYASERKKEKNYCRTTLLRLLKHWPSEVDRARAWYARKHHIRKSPTKESGTATESDFKQAGAIARAELERFRKEQFGNIKL